MLLLLIQFTLFYAGVLILVALGGMFSERSGVINLGLEGCMVIGALGGALVLRYLSKDTPTVVVILLCTVVSALLGLAYSMLLGVAAIKFKADQTITGTALNILAPALGVVIVKAITKIENGQATNQLKLIPLKNKFIFHLGEIEFNYYIILAFILIAVAFVLLYKTKFGLRLMSCGEFPQASASAGINVIKSRYIGVGIGGILAGIGGFAYICTNAYWQVDSGVAGFGFLALAVMIFGQWKPILIGFGAIIFGFFRGFQYVYSSIPFFKNISIDSSFYKMLPYIVCLVVLMFTSKKSRAPKAEGIPYDKGLR